MKYLHTMIRVSDPAATIAFFELLGLRELNRFDSEQGRFSLIFLAADQGTPGQGEQGLGRRVLEFGGDRRALLRQLVERHRMGVRGVEMAGGELGRGRERVRVEHGDAVAQRARRHREHAAELPAAHEPEGGARPDHSTSGSCMAATCSLSFSR